MSSAAAVIGALRVKIFFIEGHLHVDRKPKPAQNHIWYARLFSVCIHKTVLVLRVYKCPCIFLDNELKRPCLNNIQIIHRRQVVYQ